MIRQYECVISVLSYGDFGFTGTATEVAKHLSKCAPAIYITPNNIRRWAKQKDTWYRVCHEIEPIPRKDTKEYQHQYYLNVTKPKRQRASIRRRSEEG